MQMLWMAQVRLIWSDKDRILGSFFNAFQPDSKDHKESASSDRPILTFQGDALEVIKKNEQKYWWESLHGVKRG